ncbi:MULTISPECIES: alpha/beta hydrolase [Nocardiaceae]|uniref:alpha/beta hydrolase n=1 Tax=Nocardiaceae TaxID=85025 RepID=UPI000B9B810E|nr:MULTISPECIES: alpha/beta fold hydrolase [Rhodococcus]MBY4209525.1 alpha/beta fold hydrolase [Rhodococcus fascians]MDR6912773.1 pimeloyl-ACP methyl ester carboxylesterase [Rhodococcus sp. 3258]MDR6934374.1 pimeloyl-ACP methyl ester carboxylesterase [Rhodococcus fascians]NIL91333.1 2-succinyl-6-hydroxy-2,4-cyclohexadiene-1-carboxylate synthase [Rhodococcus fascians]OZD57242.1 alpha/beta hydrolase [Rhodococcus sp. 06-1460-1B]
MPFFDGATGAVHYRTWTVADARFGLVFLHGLGQNSAHYHRFARLLNERGVDVWAVDHVGHGLTEGELTDAAQIPGLAQNALQLIDIAEAEHPELSFALMGHSLGAATAIAALGAHPEAVRCAILCGTPKSVTGSVDDLSDNVIPLLAVHGVDDRLAPVDAVREWIGRVPQASLREFEDGGHDLLHEKIHQAVTTVVAEFLDDHMH